ncbi:hypothetical protein [Sneathiella sp. HT1-7]|jgi:hypothetical protein|uniref:hypothetical protein n=1 Tax=Sneathiella sp. HT1-7 TaxID=2887192 RepID=UPI001D15A811|nr:hypothetical protein [Sneathiella sp. HT1-7]MCC3304374.1 hypothetical protein [Sneathiella sp. HT1-7]
MVSISIDFAFFLKNTHPLRKSENISFLRIFALRRAYPGQFLPAELTKEAPVNLLLGNHRDSQGTVSKWTGAQTSYFVADATTLE